MTMNKIKMVDIIWISQMKFFKNVASLGGLTLISRLAGFFRDQIAAILIGIGPMMDAFVIAYRLPNLFRSLFAEGAFHNVFVPLFSRRLEREGKEGARIVAGKILTLMSLFLLTIIIIVELFMPQFIHIIAGGQAVQIDLTVHLARIMFPYMIIIALASAGAAMMNSLERFIASSMLPIILNLTMIFVILFFRDYFLTPAHAYAYSVILAGFIQWIWISYFCVKNQIFPHFNWPVGFWRKESEIRLFIRRFIPGMMASSVYQISALLGTRIASATEGGNSWLYYADRLYQLPLGVIGVAVATALLPTLSKKLEKKEFQGAIEVQNRALEMTFILTLPCVIGFIILGQDITHILFEHGRFMSEDTQRVSFILSIYACGLPAAVIIRSLSAGFFGRGDAQSPLRAAIVALLVFVLFNVLILKIGGGFLKGYIIVAMASSLAVWVQALYLAIFLLRKKYWRPSRQLIKSIFFTMILSMGLAVILWMGRSWLLSGDYSFVSGGLRLLFLIVFSGSLFLFFASILGLLKRLWE